MGKRKIDRTRSKKKPREEMNAENQDKYPSNGFTTANNEEEVHLENNHKKRRNCNNDTCTTNGDNDNNDCHNVATANDSDNEINKDDTNVDNNCESNDDDCDDGDNEGIEENEDGDDDDEEEGDKNKFEVRQRVLARDQDGVLYHANIRRKIYGVNHHKSISCLGIFDIAPEEIENEMNFNEDNNQNEWHYFVHYEGWKVLWDRWVSESDIWEVTAENLDRMKEISKAHKVLQMEFKNKTKKRKIQNGGLFLKKWKERLDSLHRQWAENDTMSSQQRDNNSNNNNDNDNGEKDHIKKMKKRKKSKPKKKIKKSSTEILHSQSELAMQSCLTNRQPSHIQAIVLSFGLKRILVEDWENLNSTSRAEEAAPPPSTANFTSSSNRSSPEARKWDMVHVLPEKVTIRNVISLYLKEKGISWDGINKNQKTTSSSSESSYSDVTLHKNERNGESNQTNISSKLGQSSPLIQDEQKETLSNMNVISAKVEIEILPKPEQAVMMEKDEQEEISTTGNTKGTCIQIASDTNESNQVENLSKSGKGTVMKDDNQEAKLTTTNIDGVPKDLNGNNNNKAEVSLQLVKEWTDMADGIVLYFEQALVARLLYPSEISQLLVLEENLPDDAPFLQMVDIYGCEHLLRLLASLPRILDQQSQDSRKKKLERKEQNASTNEGNTMEQERPEHGNDDNDNDKMDADQDAFHEVGSMILAKLQDFARFLQKNQSSFFGSLYRKKNEQEINRDLKIQKRHERRRLKSVAAASSLMLQKTNEEVEQPDVSNTDDEPMQCY